MPKLNLKRTPEEEAAHQWHKRQKREKREKRQRRRPREKEIEDGSSSEAGPSQSYTPNDDAIRAELEDKIFKEKMAMAFEDDERLDSLESRLNNVAHIPQRWGGTRANTSRSAYDDDTGEFMKLDPAYMDEEEYTEWIRAGMYRKTHVQEFEELKKKKADKAARKAKECAARAETERIEKAVEEERKQKRLEKENRKWDYARDEYHSRWKDIASHESLTFSDIPWPILAAHKQRKTKIYPEDMTQDAIATFLFTSLNEKEKKERLRETFLRFHPDKFEGRLMSKVVTSDKEKVKVGLSHVVRVLNDLIANAKN